MDNVKTQSYFMIADSHIAGDDDAARFFNVLAAAETLPEDVGILFLGDIFELWIALPDYETDRQARFLEWCSRERSRREILFIEGNHEFFCTNFRKNSFTEISCKHIRRNTLLFLHGDLINRKDIPYFLLRTGVRNGITRLLMRLTGRAFGPRLSHHIRMSLKTTNMVNKKVLPFHDLDGLMERAGKNGISDIFTGHFHDRKDFEKNGVHLHILPAFSNTEEVGFFDIRTNTYTVQPWQNVMQSLKTEQGDNEL